MRLALRKRRLLIREGKGALRPNQKTSLRSSFGLVARCFAPRRATLGKVGC